MNPWGQPQQPYNPAMAAYYYQQQQQAAYYGSQPQPYQQLGYAPLPGCLPQPQYPYAQPGYAYPPQQTYGAAPAYYPQPVIQAPVVAPRAPPPAAAPTAAIHPILIKQVDDVTEVIEVETSDTVDDVKRRICEQLDFPAQAAAQMRFIFQGDMLLDGDRRLADYIKEYGNWKWLETEAVIYVLLLKDPERMERLHANLSGLIRLSCHLKDRHRRGDAIDWRREVEAISLDSRLAVGERQLRELALSSKITDEKLKLLLHAAADSISSEDYAVPRAVHWRAVSEQIEREREAAAADADSDFISDEALLGELDALVAAQRCALGGQDV